MFDPAANLRGTVFRVRATKVDVTVLRRGQSRATLGAVLWHGPGAFSAVSQLDDRTQNLGDDVPRFSQNHRVADQHALLDDNILIMQGRLAHNGTRNSHGFHHRVGRRATGSANSDDDVQQHRVDLLGRVLIGNRPARRPRRRAERLVQFEIVDLDDDTVDVVFDVVTVLAVAFDKRDRVGGVRGHRPVR